MPGRRSLHGAPISHAGMPRCHRRAKDASPPGACRPSARRPRTRRCSRRASRRRCRVESCRAATRGAASPGDDQASQARRARIPLVAEPARRMHEGRRRSLSMTITLAAMLPMGAIAVEHEVVPLRELSPLAARDQIAHRLLSPLARREYDRVVAGNGLRVRDQDIATGEEHYDVFVPEAAGDGEPLGLLVYISPGDEFRLPPGWGKVLERERLVLVAARNSGNSRNMVGRRVPLALHGHALATSRYRIDPERVYIAGFSGGGRVAQLVAFAYPDVFRGVLMFAGSDPFGEGAVPPPPRELMEQVQSRLRVVQSTGLADSVNIAIDSRMRRGMARMCIRNVDVVDQPRLGHGLPRAPGFSRAVDALLEPVRTPTVDEGCRAGLQERVDEALAEVEAMLAD